MKPIVVFAMLLVFDRVMSFIPIVRRLSFKVSCAHHMHIRYYKDQSTCRAMTSSTTSDVDDPLLTPISSKEYNISNMPSIFGYPHYYDPHPIAKYASERLKEQLYTSYCFKSMLNSTDIIGKMMGVLVVQYDDTDNNNTPHLGYLQAYSGTLTNDETTDMHFCPPVFDRYDKDGSYKAGEDELNELNRLIDQLESNPELSIRRERLTKLQEEQRSVKWSAFKKQQRDLLAMRDELSNEEYTRFDKRLKQEKRETKKLKSQIIHEIQVAKNAVNELEQHIQSLKDEHITKCNQLQDTLFNQYNFLNIYSETKSLLPMFANTTIQRPPLGAGDCVAPKLLQYAFIKGYKPIAMAQFWYGNSPRNEVKRHNLYYPACRGKCGPILEHMLKGIEVEENPLQQINTEVELEILYEDDYIVVVNKPEGILSQPGKYLEYSIHSLLKERYPNATGPLLVHRLDLESPR